MNLILLGAPGAGKGTQAEAICKEFKIPAVSTGNLLREAVKIGDVLGLKAKSYMDLGKLVPDEIVIEMLKERIAKDDCKNGFILDGFPRNLSQVEIYESICEKSNLKNIIIVVDIPKEIGEKRITGRRVCMNCGKVYNVNIEESKPKELGKCDGCGHDLTKRVDDNLETYDHRFDVYVNETAPIIDYYKNSSKIYHIYGTKSLDDVFSYIEKVIEDNL